MKVIKKLLVILIIAIPFFIAALVFIPEFSLFLSYGEKQELVGQLEREESSIDKRKINEFFNKHYIAERDFPVDEKWGCKHDFWGKDERFFYIYLICGDLINNKISFGFGIPTRVEFGENGDLIEFSQPESGESYGTSLHWIIPSLVHPID